MMKLPPDIALRRGGYDEAQAEQWVRWLSEEERARWQAFAIEKRRREFLLGRAVARQLVGERLELEPSKAPLKTAESGAVDVAGASLFVSIAHSGDQAVAAVADRAVGVDLERVRERRSGLHRFVLHPDEHRLFDDLPLERHRTLILAWTLKEAVLKALRTGLRMAAPKLRVDVDFGRRAATVQTNSQGTWPVRFDERGPYCLAVAFAPPPQDGSPAAAPTGG